MVILLAALVLVFFVLFNAGFFGGKDERVRITCAGDSLTYGSGVLKSREIDSYPAQLQVKLGTTYLVSNYGLRQATASANGDLPYLKSEEYAQSLKSKPDVVLLMLGTNDSKTNNWNSEDYENGLRQLVESYQNLDTKPIVYLMRSPYCYAVKGGSEAEYHVQPQIVSNDIGQIVSKVADDRGVKVIDLYTDTEGLTDIYTSDGIHLNKSGYHLISQLINDAIKYDDGQQ